MQNFQDLGEIYDVVEVTAEIARMDLIPLQKAVYASPFDLKYYARKKEVIIGKKPNAEMEVI